MRIRIREVQGSRWGEESESESGSEAESGSLNRSGSLVVRSEVAVQRMLWRGMVKRIVSAGMGFVATGWC